MPTFDEYETSPGAAAPIELFKFDAPNKSYRYTSDAQSVFVLGGTFTPEPIARSAIVATNGGEGVKLEIIVPASLAVVADMAFDYAPPESLTVTVYRYHDDDLSTLTTFWQGSVSSITVEGNRAKIVAPSALANALSASLPGKTYQGPCNHTLFDGRCRVSRAAMTAEGVASSVTASEVRTLAALSAAEGYYQGGEVIHVATGERRLVTASSGDALTINFPFRSLKAGDTVKIVPGCDHSPETCRAKFANIENFGGFPFIPTKNIFRDGLQ